MDDKFEMRSFRSKYRRKWYYFAKVIRMSVYSVTVKVMSARVFVVYMRLKKKTNPKKGRKFCKVKESEGKDNQ